MRSDLLHTVVLLEMFAGCIILWMHWYFLISSGSIFLSCAVEAPYHGMSCACLRENFNPQILHWVLVFECIMEGSVLPLDSRTEMCMQTVSW